MTRKEWDDKRDKFVAVVLTAIIAIESDATYTEEVEDAINYGRYMMERLYGPRPEEAHTAGFDSSTFVSTHR